MSLIAKYVFRGNCTTEAITENGQQKIKISGPCYSCGQSVSVTVNADDYADFERGKHAQHCFSYIPAGEREFLISGICDTCWDKMFAEVEEE